MGVSVEETTELVCWDDGEKDRPLKVSRPCTCATCATCSPEGALGILSGSDHKGRGFSLWIFEDESYVHLREIFGGEK